MISRQRLPIDDDGDEPYFSRGRLFCFARGSAVPVADVMNGDGRMSS